MVTHASREDSHSNIGERLSDDQMHESVPQDDSTSSKSTDMEVLLSTQVSPAHSSSPILKNVVTNDIEKIKKAWEAGYTPYITKKGK